MCDSDKRTSLLHRSEMTVVKSFIILARVIEQTLHKDLFLRLLPKTFQMGEESFTHAFSKCVFALRFSVHFFFHRQP